MGYLKHATNIALIMETCDWIKEIYHPHNTYTHSTIGKEIHNSFTVYVHQEIIFQHCENHQANRIYDNQTVNMDANEDRKS